jgi:rhodanese-related sulfurtransferase/DNA-directed RNA polymerase subunit RPC12/RpoP
MKLSVFLLMVAGMLLMHSRSILPDDKYKCLPCGQECDKDEYSSGGKCDHCGMELVKSSTVIFKTIKAEEICDYISRHPTAVLLDVRTKEEFEGTAEPNFGTLKNAINIPIGEINDRIRELSKFKSREIVVFCSHSHRSPQVSYLLTQNGFKKVTNMDGGMSVVTDVACKR